MDSLIELTDSSPVIGQPKQIIKTLTRYQKAMLYKALVEIENKDMKFGFIGDKPGVGKTAVILALIVAEKIINKDSQTIVVVPQNLLQQWENEIKKFCDDSVKYLTITTYGEARDFYDEDNLTYFRSFDIILTTSTMYKLLRDIMTSIDYTVKRVVFDEIDTIETVFDNLAIAKLRAKKNKMFEEENKKMNKASFYNMVWYISASIVNLFDDDTFILGDFKLSKEEFNKHYIKCNDDFVQTHSLNKFVTKEEKLICDSIVDIYEDFLSVEQLDNINSMSFNKIIGEYTSKAASCENDTILIIVEDYYIHHSELVKTIDDLNTKIKKYKQRFRDTTELEKKLKVDEATERFYKECLDNFYNVVGANTFQEFKEKYKNTTFNEENSKLHKVTNYIGSIKDKKVIIFSDHTDGFNHLIKFFDEKEIKYTDLAKGNLKDLAKAIDDYKNDDTNFLLIDSASEGCGLNLENTDTIIFLHRINETLTEQMIGRALRPGRKNDLVVLFFLNKNENV